MSSPQFNPKLDPKKRGNDPESPKKRVPLADEESSRQRNRDRDRDHGESDAEQDQSVLGGEA